VSGVKYQRVKPAFGTDGSATDVSGANPLPVIDTSPIAAGTNTIGSVNIASFVRRTTFVVLNNTASGALAANTRKDIFSLHHLNTSLKTIKILRIEASWLATTALAGDLRFFIYRGAAAATAGTAATPAGVSAANTTTESVATINPTIVAATLLLAHIVGSVPATANSILARTILYDATNDPQEDRLTLRAGVTEALSIAITSTAAINWTPFIQVFFEEE
jgi:hypothetical protein